MRYPILILLGLVFLAPIQAQTRLNRMEKKILKPLDEVRRTLAEELAKSESDRALVPIDRDPVPSRFSDLVEKYYERLGEGK